MTKSERGRLKLKYLFRRVCKYFVSLLKYPEIKWNFPKFITENEKRRVGFVFRGALCSVTGGPY